MLKKYNWFYDKNNIYSKFPKILQNDIDKPFMDALDIEIDKLKEAFTDLFNQFFVSTATWGLEFWEDLVKIETNEKLSYETRRSNVMAEMRRRDITTVEVIKKVAEAYSNGECDVIEDFEHYIFTIKFIGVRGIPEALGELDKVIRKIKPAHLAHKYEYSYLIWDEFDSYNKTWDEWEALGITWDELEVYMEKNKGGVDIA